MGPPFRFVVTKTGRGGPGEASKLVIIAMHDQSRRRDLIQVLREIRLGEGHDYRLRRSLDRLRQWLPWVGQLFPKCSQGNVASNGQLDRRAQIGSPQRAEAAHTEAVCAGRGDRSTQEIRARC
jgi:hypothetical protein